MASVRIEPGESTQHFTCEGCGGTSWSIHGYVYEDEEPAAVYYADWCEGAHEVRAAFITLSVGRYGDELATGADRLSYAIEARCEGLGLMEHAVRDRPEILGRFVARTEAMQSPDLAQVWHICDHLTDDRRFAGVTAWLCGHLETAVED